MGQWGFCNTNVRYDGRTVLHMKGHTGAIRIMTTIAKAGECTRDIGTVRTTTMAAGETMIATIMIATVTTDRDAPARRTGLS